MATLGLASVPWVIHLINRRRFRREPWAAIDLLGDPNDTLNGIRHLRHRGHEPIVLHILDPAELTFPFDRAVRFEGMEGTGVLLTDPRVMRERYLHEINEYIQTLRRGCHRQQADYELLDTATPLSTALTAYLATRSSGTQRSSRRPK